jgi:hypothetical protein
VSSPILAIETVHAVKDLLFCLLLIVVWTVLAAKKQEQLKARMLAASGNIKYQQRRLQDAITLFERAYAMDYDRQDVNMAIYLHNWGHVSDMLV